MHPDRTRFCLRCSTSLHGPRPTDQGPIDMSDFCSLKCWEDYTLVAIEPITKALDTLATPSCNRCGAKTFHKNPSGCIEHLKGLLENKAQGDGASDQGPTAKSPRLGDAAATRYGRSSLLDAVNEIFTEPVLPKEAPQTAWKERMLNLLQSHVVFVLRLIQGSPPIPGTREHMTGARLKSAVEERDRYKKRLDQIRGWLNRSHVRCECCARAYGIMVEDPEIMCPTPEPGRRQGACVDEKCLLHNVRYADPTFRLEESERQLEQLRRAGEKVVLAAREAVIECVRGEKELAYDKAIENLAKHCGIPPLEERLHRRQTAVELDELTRNRVNDYLRSVATELARNAADVRSEPRVKRDDGILETRVYAHDLVCTKCNRSEHQAAQERVLSHCFAQGYPNPGHVWVQVKPAEPEPPTSTVKAFNEIKTPATAAVLQAIGANGEKPHECPSPSSFSTPRDEVWTCGCGQKWVWDQSWVKK